MRKLRKKGWRKTIVLVLSPAVLVLDSKSEARLVIINIHGILFRLHPMVPFEYEYEARQSLMGTHSPELVVYGREVPPNLRTVNGMDRYRSSSINPWYNPM